MAGVQYYRGGRSLIARPFEVKLDPVTGLVGTPRGVSVSNKPDGLEKFGGAYFIADLPPELRIIQVGNNPHHFEIVPASPMPFDEYQGLLNRIVLVPV
jgi:hypothetical protein